jgi:hypothetical protein
VWSGRFSELPGSCAGGSRSIGESPRLDPCRKPSPDIAVVSPKKSLAKELPWQAGLTSVGKIRFGPDWPMAVCPSIFSRGGCGFGRDLPGKVDDPRQAKTWTCRRTTATRAGAGRHSHQARGKSGKECKQPYPDQGRDR